VVLTLCFKVFMPPHMLYMCSVFIFSNTDKKKHVILIKNVGHMFCQILNCDDFGWFVGGN